jgi:thiol-disulfide isomerase/thioredoxin
MNKTTRYTTLGVVVLILVALIVWYKAAPSKYDGLANYLTQSGVKMYGAFWCPHCQAEKKAFGKSESKLPYVECSEQDETTQTPICIQEKIVSYPTWDFPNPIILQSGTNDSDVACKQPYTADQPEDCELATPGEYVLTVNNMSFLTPTQATLANGVWTLPPHSRTSGTVAPEVLGQLAGYKGKD